MFDVHVKVRTVLLFTECYNILFVRSEEGREDGPNASPIPTSMCGGLVCRKNTRALELLLLLLLL